MRAFIPRRRPPDMFADDVQNFIHGLRKKMASDRLRIGLDPTDSDGGFEGRTASVSLFNFPL
ncbi:hypothetical protein QSH57_003132 [Fusarium oxysporum f. sp. vasinfectum]|nr:hypothetical protein QSH57_003132 [Fusarium oxysporum f. sp. vasinfectum]